MAHTHTIPTLHTQLRGALRYSGCTNSPVTHYYPPTSVTGRPPPPVTPGCHASSSPMLPRDASASEPQIRSLPKSPTDARWHDLTLCLDAATAVDVAARLSPHVSRRHTPRLQMPPRHRLLLSPSITTPGRRGRRGGSYGTQLRDAAGMQAGRSWSLRCSVECCATTVPRWSWCNVN